MLKLLQMPALLGCFLCLLGFVSSSSVVWAQAMDSVPAAVHAEHTPQADFSNEPFVVSKADTLYSFKPDGTGFRDQAFAIKIQSEAALRAFSVLNVAFAADSEQVRFRYARVRHPDGTVVTTPPEGALEQPEPVTREAPLYSDLKQKQLPVKSLGVGDTLEWQVHIERFQAEARNQFWGQQSFLTGAVILAETVELRVPAGMSVQVWTNAASNLQPATTTDAGQRIYRWAKASLDPTVGVAAEAAAKQKAKQLLTPEQELDLREGKEPDVAWTSFRSWAAVGEWYRTLEQGKTEPNAAITAKVAEITAGKSSPADKAEAVYTFVSGEIRYVGIDLGAGRYQPHSATEVLENRYGDCKDKHTLLAAMLQVLGLQPKAVLIGSGLRFNADVPSPGSFNHLITETEVDGKPVWLDTTEEVAPFGMLFATLRDKRALVVPANGAALVQRTPADPPFATFEHLTANGSLDKDGVSESHFSLTLRGDEELLTRMALRQISAAQYDQFVQGFVGNLGFSGTVSHPAFQHADDPSQPLIMEWDYHREQAGNDWGNLRTVPQLMMVLLPAVDEKTPPTGTTLLFGARSVTTTSELKLPEGWSAELPSAVHANSEFGTYDMTFRYSSGTLFAERKWTLLEKEIPQNKWKPYKTWTDAVGLGNEPYVQLRNTAAGPAVAKTSDKSVDAGSPEAKAGQLVEEASMYIRAAQYDMATPLLDKAKALNETQRTLWGSYGAIAFHRENFAEAKRLYAKEIQLHPESTWVYPTLAQLQLSSGDPNAAVATMRRYVTQLPQDATAASALINTLMAAGRSEEAAAEADAAYARLPPEAQSKPSFVIVAGRAQLQGGEVDKGKETLATLIGSSTDPGVLNDAAYELANAQQDLPLAEATARQVVSKLETQSASWTLADASSVQRSTSRLLAAAWDTLGWTLFHEGKPAEAELYIRAAWLNSQHAEVGQHLGDVQFAQGHKEVALTTYELALAAVPVVPGSAPEPLPGSRVDQLRARVAKAGGPASALPTVQERKELQALRTLPLAGKPAHAGTADYRLLFTAQKVKLMDAQDVKTDAKPEADPVLYAAKLPAGSFPPGSNAVLMRTATLNCHADLCEAVLHP